MSWILVAPIAVPMTTAVLCILLWSHRPAQRQLSAIGAAAHLAAAILLMTQVVPCVLIRITIASIA